MLLFEAGAVHIATDATNQTIPWVAKVNDDGSTVEYLSSEAKLGTGPQAVCMQCHNGGRCLRPSRGGNAQWLDRLDDTIKNAHAVLGVAESSCMEVSQARLDEDQARDALTKARVTIHSFPKELVDQDIEEGLKIAAKNLQAGKTALAERDYRRNGLGIATVFILISVVGCSCTSGRSKGMRRRPSGIEYEPRAFQRRESNALRSRLGGNVAAT